MAVETLRFLNGFVVLSISFTRTKPILFRVSRRTEIFLLLSSPFAFIMALYAGLHVYALINNCEHVLGALVEIDFISSSSCVELEKGV